MLPAPPPTFSMMTGCCPSDARRRSAKMRASASVGPPGGYGTIIVIGRDGNGCGTAPERPRATTHRIAATSLTMGIALFLLHIGDCFRDRLPNALLLLDESRHLLRSHRLHIGADRGELRLDALVIKCDTQVRADLADDRVRRSQR